MGGLEDDPDAAERVRLGAELRVHQRRAGGQRAFREVMIEDEAIDPRRAQPGDLRRGRGAAIDRHEELRAARLQAARDPVLAEPVPFIHAQRQEALHLRAVEPEDAGEERQRSDAIHVVIAVKDDPLAPVDRPEETGDRRLHPRQEKGIAQRLQLWIEKPRGLLQAGKAAPAEQPRDKRRHPQRLRERAAARRVIRRRENPLGHGGRVALSYAAAAMRCSLPAISGRISSARSTSASVL